MTRTPEQRADLKHRALVETKKIFAIAAYLYLVLTAMEVYKAYITHERVIVDFKLGYNFIESLLLAKVVLIGDLLHLGERFRRWPAIVPTIAKAFIFACFVALFSILETLVEHLFHHQDLVEAWRAVVALDRGTIAIHVVLMFLNFVPLFATWESARIIGEEKFIDMFFERPKAT